MKIVITGGNSFIGQRLIKEALRSGHEIISVVRQDREAVWGAGVKVVQCAMDEYGKLGERVGSCDCLIHLAWNGTRGSTRMDRAVQEENCENSINCVRALLEQGCKKIISAGSQAEYGLHADIITEETECVPNTEYGKAKLDFYHKASKLCEMYEADFKEPRFFSLYGENDYPGTMIISILRDMLAGRTCKLTEGKQMWDFLYISDAVDGMLRLCEMPCPNGVYNFGSGDVRQLKEYVLEMARITHTKSTIEFGAIPYTEAGIVSIWPDITKMEKYLGWRPRVTFSEGISRILDTITRGVQ